MDKNTLDNMSGQELKEMIDSEVITLNDLDNTTLEKIMNYEIDMLCFGTGDMTTIRRCSELLDERNDSDTLNKDRIISIIDKAQQEHVVIIDKEETYKSKAKVIKRNNIALRRIGIVAAILTIMIATTTLVAAAFGVNIFEYIGKIVRQDNGFAIHTNEFTFHNGGEAKKFSSVKEMVESESLDIMYPSKLPSGISVNTVIVNKGEQENDSIHIATNNNNICIVIEINSKAPEGTRADCSVYESNGLQYYIFYEETYFATCYYNNCSYSIQANNYNELILIIDNMKEKK